MKRLVGFCIFFLVIGSIAAQRKNLFINRIVIDPGHGGHDPGTQGKLYKEKDIALDIAIELGKFIHENNPNVEIIFTRTSDKFVPLFQRIGMANKYKADFFVSIHCNSSKKTTVRGTETYVMGIHKEDENLAVAQRENEVVLLENDYETNYEGFDPKSPVGHIILSSFQDAYLNTSLEVAAAVEEQLNYEGYSTSRGVKQAGFAVLRRATMPSILVETGFLSNETEEKLLGSKSGKTSIAHSIYRALSPFMNAKISSDITSTTANNAPSQGVPSTIAVQFAAMKNKIDIATKPELSKIGQIEIFEENDFYKYKVTGITDMEAAKKVREQLRKLGYGGAFIISSE